MPKKKGGRICAVIEIGSDMVTMQIAQNRNGSIDILDRLECFFDLEKETATTGRIGQASVQELCRILNGYRQEMEAFDVEQYRLFSTDFLRSAENFIFFESQLMDYPVGYGDREKEKILAAFLRGYQSVRPFTQEQKKAYPYFVAMIRAFWSMDIKWKENSLCQVVEREDWESARAWLQEIDRRLRERPAWPIEE